MIIAYHRSLIDQLKAAKEIEALTAEVLMLRDQIETCSKKDIHEENMKLRERNWFLEARDYEPPKTIQEPCPRCSQPWIRHDCPVKSGGAELSASEKLFQFEKAELEKNLELEKNHRVTQDFNPLNEVR
jgi:hypothetical protein